jgi:glucose-6-phosphate isomerase
MFVRTWSSHPTYQIRNRTTAQPTAASAPWSPSALRLNSGAIILFLFLGGARVVATSTSKSSDSKLLAYDWSGTQLPETGLPPEAIQDLSSQLGAARREVLDEDLPMFRSGAAVPSKKQPLDAGFIDLPERLLDEYRQDRESSELHQILGAARRLRDEVDRVVVLGIGGSYMGARALMESCAHPYHNELSRGERGGSPRLYFEGNNVDNDSVAALLDLLGRGKVATGVDEAWGIVVISKSGGTLETAAAFRIFFGALLDSCGGDMTQAAARVIPVTGQGSKLAQLTGAIGVQDVFPVPDGVGGRFSILSAVGLLPAAILGLDIVALLEGAAAMNEHFRTAPPGDNRVLDFTGVCHLMEKQRGATIRVLSVWANALEAAGFWYDQLLAESLGKFGLGATPLTVLNTRDLHSRAQQHQEGSRDKLFTNITVDSWRQDALAIGRSQRDQDDLNRIAERTLPELMNAAMEGTGAAYREDGRPTADIRMPNISEFTMGQLFQMLMLATVVEGRLIGVNPYGQPGVEAYKKHMKKILKLG